MANAQITGTTLAHDTARSQWTITVDYDYNGFANTTATATLTTSLGFTTESIVVHADGKGSASWQGTVPIIDAGSGANFELAADGKPLDSTSFLFQ